MITCNPAPRDRGKKLKEWNPKGGDTFINAANVIVLVVNPEQCCVLYIPLQIPSNRMYTIAVMENLWEKVDINIEVKR
jgi:hypothetical protein